MIENKLLLSHAENALANKVVSFFSKIVDASEVSAYHAQLL
tara:strand:- start:70 stop:192 length:123 start_codon:yes stop_codon:yes gene_type:complete